MIYIDLDDVTADFLGYCNKVLGTNLKVGEKLPPGGWATIRSEHQRIFRDLEPIPAMELWIREELIANRIPFAFLTAVPFDPDSPWQHAGPDKIDWVRGIFGENQPVFLGPYAHDKVKHCQKGDILIDDNERNCKAWNNAGGFAHMFRGVKGLENWYTKKRVLQIAERM